MEQLKIQLANYPNGVRVFETPDVEPGATRWALFLDRCTTATPTIWPNVSTTLKIDAEMSTDGGVTWEYASGSSPSPGGIQIGSDGVMVGENAVYEHSAYLRPAPSRRLRISVVIAGGPLRTSGSVQTL